MPVCGWHELPEALRSVRYVSEQGINLMRLIATQKSIINDREHGMRSPFGFYIEVHARTAIAKRADAI